MDSDASMVAKASGFTLKRERFRQMEAECQKASGCHGGRSQLP